jgi:hypothetical protein
MKKFRTKDDYGGSGLRFQKIGEEAEKAANKAMESINREVIENSMKARQKASKIVINR